MKSHEDRNFDGKPDAWHYYENEALIRGEFDDNFDGNVDIWTAYSGRYDYETKYDNDFDGTPDVTTFIEAGVQQRTDWHPGSAKNVFRRTIFKDGLQSEEFVDTDQDGQFDRKCGFNEVGDRVDCEPYSAG